MCTDMRGNIQRLSDRIPAMKLGRVGVLLFACGVVVLHAQSPRRVALLITGGIVVTVDEARHVYNPGAVAIDGTDIVGVGTAADVAARFPGADAISAAAPAVMPCSAYRTPAARMVAH